MDNDTQRRLAVLRRRDRTIRSGLEVTQQVSESQILDVAAARPRVIPLTRRKEPTLGDGIAREFFVAGDRQEAAGVFHETEHVRVRSLDRVPRRWSPTLLVLLLVLAGGGAAAWSLGYRPPAEWQRSHLWQALRLPPMPPP
jgi:hypothetical protein